MLASMPAQEDTALDTFVFTVSLISRGDKNVSDAARDYVRRVLLQARLLAYDAKSVTERIMPEAVTLALEMQRKKDFSAQIEQIKDAASVDQRAATDLLTAVEHAFVRED